MKNEIGRFLAIVGRRWLIVLIVMVMGFALMPLVASNIPTYKAQAELLVVSEAQKDPTGADPDLPSIIASTVVMNRVISRLGLHTTAAALAQKIKTKTPAKSSILDVTYKDTNGQRAANVVNAVVDESVNYYHELATRGYGEVLKALSSRISESQVKVASADRLLQQASAKDAFASSDNALSDMTTQFDTLRGQRDQAKAVLAADSAMEATLKSQSSSLQPIARGEVLQKDVVYQQAQAGYAKDVAELVSQRSSFQDSFPGLAALAKRTDRENGQLKRLETAVVANDSGLSPTETAAVLDRQHAAGLVAADHARVESIDQQLVDEQLHLQTVAGAGAAVGTLRARRDAILQQYMTLTQRLSSAQADAAAAASLGTLVVVSRAEPGPSGMLLYLIVIAAIVIALALASAYVAEALNPRLWGVREIEKTYRRPVFAELGSFK